MDEQERRYTAAEAARMIGCNPGTLVHYARRFLALEHRPGQRFQLTNVQVEHLRTVLATPRPRQPKRQQPRSDRQ